MFRIVEGNKVPCLLDALEEYLKAPEWVHAPQVVPMWAAIAEDVSKDGDLPWSEAPSQEVVGHLEWSLNTWTAFRGTDLLPEKLERFRQHLPEFVRGVRAALAQSGVPSLADLDGHGVERLYHELKGPFDTFGSEVKPSAIKTSRVLPSKVAHLLFPSFVPAYDEGVVKKKVLGTLMPKGMTYRTRYRTWLALCWICLRTLQDQGSLKKGRERIVSHLVEAWPVGILRGRAPPRNESTLRYADSFLAEYTLIGLARRGTVEVIPADDLS